MRKIVALTAGLAVAIFAWAAEDSGAKKNAGANEGKVKAIKLFNGENLDGWKPFSDKGSPDETWSIEDGVLKCSGEPAGYVRTTEPYSNYVLTFEWRWPGEGGNSGLLMHIQEPDRVWPKSIEGQLMSENAADFFVIEGSEFKEHTTPDDRRVPKKHDHNEKPLGEWNKYKAVVKGNTIRLYINGLLQNEATETNITEGFIALQSEGTPIEFRNVKLRPAKDEEPGDAVEDEAPGGSAPRSRER